MTNDLAVTTFKERLRFTVELSGMNARALSKRAGFKSPTHISALLASKHDPNPTKKTLERLAEAAGVPLEWLVPPERAPPARGGLWGTRPGALRPPDFTIPGVALTLRGGRLPT